MDYMQNVIVIMTYDKDPLPQSIESVKAQDYPNFELILHHREAEDLDNGFQRNKTLNIAKARNEVREIALKKKADYFVWLDCDMIYPKDMISRFMANMLVEKSTVDVVIEGKTIPSGTPIPKKHIIGGWYKVKDPTNRWMAGYFSGENNVSQYSFAQQGFIKVHFLGLGCCIMSREILEKFPFVDGMNVSSLNVNLRRTLPRGACVEYCNQLCFHGYSLFMDGGIVCEHLYWPEEAKRNELLANEPEEIKKVKEQYGKPS
jgi:glycosyltransferase involved in cell wall biosynthesis